MKQRSQIDAGKREPDPAVDRKIRKQTRLNQKMEMKQIRTQGMAEDKRCCSILVPEHAREHVVGEHTAARSPLPESFGAKQKKQIDRAHQKP